MNCGRCGPDGNDDANGTSNGGSSAGDPGATDPSAGMPKALNHRIPTLDFQIIPDDATRILKLKAGRHLVATSICEER